MHDFDGTGRKGIHARIRLTTEFSPPALQPIILKALACLRVSEQQRHEPPPRR
jgi:hypothetical protein